MVRKKSKRSLKDAEELCHERMVTRKAACARVYAPDGRELGEDINGGSGVEKEQVAACHAAMREEKQCIGLELCPAQARRYYSSMCSPSALASPHASDTVKDRCRGYAYDLTGCMHAFFRQVAGRDLTSSFRTEDQVQEVMPYEFNEADSRILQEPE
mmetsp:Transcript_7291/g.31002  ORF Transcript_7291/g.31002 Transcript_7291/m.31002 type:complete len:157 (+) Transcript_7291:78-548(+)